MTTRLRLYTESHGAGAEYLSEKEAIKHATWLSFKMGERVFIKDGLRTVGSVLASVDSDFQYNTQKVGE